MNMRMLDILAFKITYEKYGDGKFLGFTRDVSEIDKAELQLIFKREKGTRVFKFHHNNSIKVGNMHYYTYKFGYYESYDYNYYPRKLVEERRMHLNWCPYKEG